MKRAAGFVLAAIFAASGGYATSYYALEVHGGSRIYAADQPIRKGRVLLFHRYPDGVYMSLAASEVEKVVALSEPPQPEGLAPGQTLFVGPAVEGPGFAAHPAMVQAGPPADMTMDSGYGYYGSYWGGGGYVPPTRPPVPPPFVPPSRIGPNGFPILASPGSPGSTPPPIGPNGFPVLAPQPQPPAPRPRPM